MSVRACGRCGDHSWLLTFDDFDGLCYWCFACGYVSRVRQASAAGRSRPETNVANAFRRAAEKLRALTTHDSDCPYCGAKASVIGGDLGDELVAWCRECGAEWQAVGWMQAALQLEAVR